MEGKEGFNEYGEPEKREPFDSDDSDNFGLPNFPEQGDEEPLKETESGSEYGLGSPYSPAYESDPGQEESGDRDSYSESLYGQTDYSSTYDEKNTEDNDFNEDDSQYTEPAQETNRKPSSPLIWIIPLLLLIAAAAVAFIWWLNKPKTPAEKAVQAPVVQAPPQVIDEAPPAFEEPAQGVTSFPSGTGDVQLISERTNRYYVVISSSIDGDLANDYALKLAKNGVDSKILAPRGNVKFYRLSIADYEDLPQASVRADQLRAEYGEGVWVIRY